MTSKFETDWYEQVPKVELHLHLEGAIPHDTLWELVRKYGGDPTVPDLESLSNKFEYKDFPHFIQAWLWKNKYLREYEDFTLIAEAVARDLARQNICYVEGFYSPSDFSGHGLQPQRLTEAIRTGLKRIPEIEFALIVDLVRDFGPDQAAVTLEKVNEVRDQGVIGIGIGGSEQDFPPEPFEAVFEQARKLGFHTTAHAGEAAGADSIWGAIHSLKVDRIGHGTRAYEDESLLDYLSVHKIPLEMNILSNVRTGVVPSIDEHPIRRYFEYGINVTINTDDPKMFNNSLSDEYRLLEEKLNFSKDEIRRLILQGVQASWLAKDRKKEYIEMFYKDPQWNPASPR